MLHYTFIRKKQMTKKQTDINDIFNKKIPGGLHGMNLHINSIYIFRMPETNVLMDFWLIKKMLECIYYLLFKKNGSLEYSIKKIWTLNVLVFEVLPFC